MIPWVESVAYSIWQPQCVLVSAQITHCLPLNTLPPPHFSQEVQVLFKILCLSSKGHRQKKNTAILLEPRTSF